MRLVDAGIGYEEQRKRGKAFASRHGIRGDVGGWLRRENGEAICQGFADLYALYRARADREAARTRLEELRTELRAERISTGELLELQGLAEYIEPGDVELLEAAGVPEFGEEE